MSKKNSDKTSKTLIDFIEKSDTSVGPDLSLKSLRYIEEDIWNKLPEYAQHVLSENGFYH